jgi:hypothetical protein
MSMKNPSGYIADGICELSSCSAVLQQPAPTRNSRKKYGLIKLIFCLLMCTCVCLQVKFLRQFSCFTKYGMKDIAFDAFPKPQFFIYEIGNKVAYARTRK